MASPKAFFLFFSQNILGAGIGGGTFYVLAKRFGGDTLIKVLATGLGALLGATTQATIRNKPKSKYDNLLNPSKKQK